VLKLPDWPPVLTSGQLPPPELLLEDDELLELEELLLEDELELLLLLDEELEELLELEEELLFSPGHGSMFSNQAQPPLLQLSL
jgi:hypothetical protein